MPSGGEKVILTRRQAEIGFALVSGLAGAIIISGAMELDTGWSRSGPESGYFPYRIGILLVAASALILIRVLFQRGPAEPLLTLGPTARLMTFVLPLVGFILLIGPIGLYLAAVAYLVVAVGVVGRAGILRSVLIAVLVPAFLFVAFEYVFKAPLPKGPLGPLFGLI